MDNIDVNSNEFDERAVERVIAKVMTTQNFGDLTTWDMRVLLAEIKKLREARNG